MSKRILFIILGIAILASGAATGYLLISGQKGTKGPASNLSSPVPAAETDETNTTYEDSSGFSFDYPSLGTKVTDMTPDNYYSLLTLTKLKDARSMKITVKDGKSSDVTFSGAKLVGGVTLGGISAKQYKNGNTLITAALDSGIVYLIEGPADGGYWEGAQNTIVSTFAFSSAQASGSGTQESIDDVSMEEVVE